MYLKLLAFDIRIRTKDGTIDRVPSGILDVETVADYVEYRDLWRGGTIECKRCLQRPFEGEEASLLHCDYPLLVDSFSKNNCVLVSFIIPKS